MIRKSSHNIGKISVLCFFTVNLLLSFPVQAANKTLVLLPFTLYADESKSYLREGIKSILMSRLSGGGLEIIGDERVTPLLTEAEKAGIKEKDRAAELARTIQADYALFGSITTVGGGYSLDLLLLDLQGEELKQTRISEAVNEDQFIPRMADVAYEVRARIEGREIPTRRVEQVPVPAQPQTAKGLFSSLIHEGEAPGLTERGLFYRTGPSLGFEPTGRISVGMSVMAFDTGDVDGAGAAELLVLGRKQLRLYQRQSEAFLLKETLKTGIGEVFLKVSVGDTNSDGRAEIYLVSRYGVRARSTVYEWTGKFKRLDRRAGHMQVVKTPGSKEATVLFQDSQPEAFFHSKIHVMNRDGEGKFTRGELLPLPKDVKGVQFYTLARYDMNKDGVPEWLGLEEPGLTEQAKLYVWDEQGEVLWSGGGKLGGTNNAINLGSAPRGDQPPRIAFNPRLVITDIDGDEKPEVLAIENIPVIEKSQGFRHYTKAKLTAFSAEGSVLVPAWSTQEISYCITDMQAQDGTIFLAAQKGKMANILVKERGYIMWFK